MATPPSSMATLGGFGGWDESLSELKSFTSYKPPANATPNPLLTTNLEEFLSSLASPKEESFDPFGSNNVTKVESDMDCPILSQARALGGDAAGFTFDLDLLCSDLKAKAVCSEKARQALAAAVSEDLNHVIG